MLKRNNSEDLSSPAMTIHNSSTDYVFYTSASKKELQFVSATRIGTRPIYKFFFEVKQTYFPLRCMLDLGSTSFVMSPEAAKAFRVPVAKRKLATNALEVGGRKTTTEGLFTIPLALSFGNHRTLDDKVHAFEVMKISTGYDAQIPAWYLNKHKAEGITTRHLHFPQT